MKWSNLYNPIMKAVLRSPIHGVISGMFMLITVTGRKSGRTYTTPVEYFYDGDTLMVFTLSERTWWRNLRGGAAVTVRVRGRDHTGTATAIAGDAAAFEQAFRAYLKRHPGREKYFGIRLEADGSFNADDLGRAAGRNVTVRIALD